jgi:hypothetical protein
VSIAVGKDIQRPVPEDPPIEDCDLLVHPRAQIHRNTQIPEVLHKFRNLISGAPARLFGRTCEHADPNSTSERRAERIYPPPGAPTGGKRREDDDGHSNP